MKKKNPWRGLECNEMVMLSLMSAGIRVTNNIDYSRTYIISKQNENSEVVGFGSHTYIMPSLKAAK